jgi:TolA-binding protein
MLARKENMKRILLFSISIAVILAGCSKPSAEEMFKKGEDAQRVDQFNNAIDAYQELIAAYPDSTRTPEAYYAIATIYQNHQRSFHQAIQTFHKLVEKYPAHATAASASFLIGFIYNNDLKNIDSARIAYKEFIKLYPASQLVASAQFELNNLGKDASEILNEQSQITEAEKRVTKKVKK